MNELLSEAINSLLPDQHLPLSLFWHILINRVEHIFILGIQTVQISWKLKKVHLVSVCFRTSLHTWGFGE